MRSQDTTRLSLEIYMIKSGMQLQGCLGRPPRCGRWWPLNLCNVMNGSQPDFAKEQKLMVSDRTTSLTASNFGQVFGPLLLNMCGHGPSKPLSASTCPSRYSFCAMDLLQHGQLGYINEFKTEVSNPSLVYKNKV